ncbi:hypothetical protein ACODUL_00450 [Stenotrophomonas maltophilia]
MLTITSADHEVFSYTAAVDGVEVELRPEGLIRSKGDAMQLGIAAVERHVAGLAPRR